MKFWRLLPSIIWMVLILVLMGTPGNYFPKVVSFWDWLSPDKVVHLIIFGIQAVLFLYGFNAGKFKPNHILIFIATVAFAGLTEVLQVYVFVGRFGSVYDFIADAIGIVIGFVAYYLLISKKKGTANRYLNRN